jgi:hypothetical protein
MTSGVVTGGKAATISFPLLLASRAFKSILALVLVADSIAPASRVF